MTRILIASGLILALAGLPSIAATAEHPTVVAVPVSVLAFGECELVCFEEDDCPDEMHDARVPQLLPADWMRNGGEHGGAFPNCKTGTCETKHGPQCIIGFAPSDLERLRTYLARDNAAGVAELIATNSEWAILNAERSAIQVKDCMGKFVAHIPAPPVMMASLSRLAMR